MVITRRLFLPLAGLMLAGAAPDIEADKETTTLRWPGLPGTLVLPSPRARTLALPILTGLDVIGVGFGQQAGDSSIDLLALVTHDGTRPRVLAIEPLQWQSPVARLNTRPTSGGNRAQFAFSRDGALRLSSTQWKRENWTDYLALKDNRAIDTPVRPPLAGTMQAKLSDRRSRTLTWLATPRQTITPTDLTTLGLSASTFDLG